MKFVVEQLDPVLAALGFVRHQTTWNRSAYPLVDVIDLQANKAAESFTVNVGVLHARAHKVCWGEDAPALVEEPLCTVRTRIGQLLDGKDLWWRDGDANAADRVLENVRSQALPFLTKMRSPEALAGQLVAAGVVAKKYPPPIIYLAVLKWEAGDAEGARALLNDLRTETLGAWQVRVDEVITRLSCSSAQ